MDCSPPGTSVHGICQARILEWVAIFFPRGSGQTRDQTCVSYVSFIGRQVHYRGATWEALCPPKCVFSKQKVSALLWQSPCFIYSLNPDRELGRLTQHNVEMLVLIAIINQFLDAQPPHAMPISTDLSLPISLLLFLSFKMPLSHHIAHPSLKPYSAACILQHLAAIAVFLQGIPPHPALHLTVTIHDWSKAYIWASLQIYWIWGCGFERRHFE